MTALTYLIELHAHPLCRPSFQGLLVLARSDGQVVDRILGFDFELALDLFNGWVLYYLNYLVCVYFGRTLILFWTLMLVRTWMLIWKIFVSMDLRFGDVIMLHFCFEQVFDKWNQFSHNKGMKFCVVSCFESLDLSYEMTVMS